ncbi:hypothetical protein EXM65_15515 [Clostridium botulinum]|uniref:Uncharacterized protein n=1 Tax=Clostridium botulinum TaxID=1491 RepID=A0A6M0SSK5_CLOBO|nr:hypothetical protein [Clostridium botulinum]
MNDLYLILSVNWEPFRAAIKKLNEQMIEHMQQIQRASAAATNSQSTLAEELVTLAQTFKEMQPVDQSKHRKKGKQIKDWNKTKFYQK